MYLKLNCFQQVITINGNFPGPLINATTNDNIHVNVFNNIDEPVLFTWNGIQQRLNSWQDGVSGTNCGIQPGKNWTFEFQVKDQIGSFFYFPSLNFQKAAGGFGPIRVNNRIVIAVPFPQPEADFDLLVGDWYTSSYKMLKNGTTQSHQNMTMLMNGKGPYLNSSTQVYESFTVVEGKTYRFRVSNVGMATSFNFRIQNHRMVVVETEGSYTDQMMVDSLDVHVGQSYSVLVTADQGVADYYIVASPKLVANEPANNGLVGIGVLRYEGSSTNASGTIPSGPDPFDLQFSIDQAKSIRWNLTAGAARPNPQGSFNVSNVTIAQTFMLRGSKTQQTSNGVVYYTVNNVSYTTPDTPLKLADLYSNGSGVYTLDQFSTNSSNSNGNLQRGVFVATGEHRGWLELVLMNNLVGIDSWHLDGYGFFVVGYGFGDWTPTSRSSYNIYNPVVRSTVQVYPKGWTAVYAYLDNPGMWNLRSQKLRNWYLGEELYLRVYDSDPNPAKELPPPSNLLLCGIYSNSTPPPSPNSPNSAPPPPSPSHASFHHIPW
ncbi:Monocopper oxidase-like protein SKU5 [Linum perenne]